MKLISLKLLNYRRFRQQEIIFKDDFSLIFGKNGAGKSSILDAIGYSLFGPGSKDFVRVNKDYSKSYFVEGREPSKIELIFQYGFDNYRIIRVIDAGIKKLSSDFITETKDTLYLPGGHQIIGGDEITNFISNLVGVNKETFLRSVFAKQKDLEVLSGGLSDRKELINKVLGLDKIEEIILYFKSQEKEKKTLLEIYKKRVSDFDEEYLKTKKEEFNLKQKDILEKLKLEENEIKILNETFDKTKLEFELQDKKRQDFLHIGSQISSNHKLIENLRILQENLKIEIEKLSKKEVYLKENIGIIKIEKTLQENLKLEESKKTQFIENQKLNEILKKYFLNLEEINKNLSVFQTSSILNQIEEFKKKLQILENTKEKKIKQKIELENKISYLRKEYEELKNELDNILKLENKADCPTCKRSLGEYFPNLVKASQEKLEGKTKEGKTLKQELEKINLEFVALQKEIDEKKLNIENYRNKEKDFIKSTQDKINLEKSILELQNRLNEIGEINFNENDFNRLILEYEKVKKDYLEYQNISGEVRNKQKLELDFANNVFQVETLIKELDILKENIYKLEFDEEKYQKLKEIYFGINSKIKSKSELIQIINKQKIEINFELQKLKNKQGEFREDKKNIDNLVLEIDYLAIKKQIMSDYIIYLLEFLKPRIEDLASEYFSIITNYKYTSITLDEDYNIMIDEKDLMLYSGGEIDLANLCLRLSLGQNLTSSKGNPINFLVLDEVLASQDKDRQQNILINLKKLESKFSQIILISHLEEIKDLATNLVEIKSINKEESIVQYC
ncbi:MAG: SMC family ATPase [Candidatus Gracilibacteria bacterium]|nr:SMC family ATPase [Candidatus Gracilibacteria bacterium]